MTETRFELEEEHEDGSATYSVEIDDMMKNKVFDWGINFMLVSYLLDKRPDDLMSELASRLAEQSRDFDEYGHYGENNPPVGEMSKPRDKDYES